MYVCVHPLVARPMTHAARCCDALSDLRMPGSSMCTEKNSMGNHRCDSSSRPPDALPLLSGSTLCRGMVAVVLGVTRGMLSVSMSGGERAWEGGVLDHLKIRTGNRSGQVTRSSEGGR